MSFDVDDAVRFGFGLFEDEPGLAGQESDGPVSLFEEFCRGMFQDETGCLLIRLEAEFLRNETDVHIGFVPMILLENSLLKGLRRKTYALHMAARADKRSRSTNMSMR